MGRFDGKTAVVTGAASGVGAASARRLAEDGARVVLVDIDEHGREIAGEVGGRFVRLDVSDADAWAALAGELRSDGGVQLAHLNAGILAAPHPEKFLDTSIDRARTMVGVNLFGVLFGIHALAPVMIAAGGGSMVATASVAGLLPYGGDPVYSATKHGVIGLVTSVAPQLGRAGVRVHAICPGGVDTPMAGGAWSSDEARARTKRTVPLGTMADAEDIASVAGFLLSDGARHVTGQTLTVDGGSTIS